MKIQLSDNFTYPRLIRFVLPSIGMMIFMSIYSVVDGFFVSNFAGKTEFAAVNLIIPVTMLPGAVGFMFGAGGSAIVSKTLGEGDKNRAARYFSMVVYASIISGIALSLLGIAFIEPIARVLGADEKMLPLCVIYARIILAAIPFFMLQSVFHSFLVTAARPDIGLYVTLCAGAANMIGDFVLVGLLRLGVSGAAVATAASQIVGGTVPLIYFISKNNTDLKLKITKFEGGVLAKVCLNGSSELLTNISMSLVSMLYNVQLMRMAGENGISAYGVMMYVQFIFVSVFVGYAVGTAPIVGYNYGAADDKELKNIFKKSMTLILFAGIAMTALSLLSAKLLAGIFVGYDEELFLMTVRGFRLFALSFLICGVSIFASSFFTALNNGPVSAAISFMRTVVFQVAAVLILPVFFDLDGVWISIVVSEALSVIVSIVFFYSMRKKYRYL